MERPSLSLQKIWNDGYESCVLLHVLFHHSKRVLNDETSHWLLDWLTLLLSITFNCRPGATIPAGFFQREAVAKYTRQILFMRTICSFQILLHFYWSTLTFSLLLNSYFGKRQWTQPCFLFSHKDKYLCFSFFPLVLPLSMFTLKREQSVPASKYLGKEITIKEAGFSWKPCTLDLFQILQHLSKNKYSQ